MTVAPRVATSISIRASVATLLLGKTVRLSGNLLSGRLADACVVEVRRPGSTTWLRSSARLTGAPNASSAASWSYAYKVAKRGTYQFRVRFAGDATRLPSLSSGTVKVAVK